ncbi:MAG: flagellar protein FlaG [Cellulosilyticaceae bacterium]
MTIQATNEVNGRVQPELKVMTTRSNQHVELQETSLQGIIEHMQQDPSYEPTLPEKMIVREVEELNQKMMGADREFQVVVHEKTREMILKIVDRSTKEIIKEIPPEKMLDYFVAMCEQAGLFVDEKR